MNSPLHSRQSALPIKPMRGAGDEACKKRGSNGLTGACKQALFEHEPACVLDQPNNVHIILYTLLCKFRHLCDLSGPEFDFPAAPCARRRQALRCAAAAANVVGMALCAGGAACVLAALQAYPVAVGLLTFVLGLPALSARCAWALVVN